MYTICLVPHNAACSRNHSNCPLPAELYPPSLVLSLSPSRLKQSPIVPPLHHILTCPPLTPPVPPKNPNENATPASSGPKTLPPSPPSHPPPPAFSTSSPPAVRTSSSATRPPRASPVVAGPTGRTSAVSPPRKRPPSCRGRSRGIDTPDRQRSCMILGLGGTRSGRRNGGWWSIRVRIAVVCRGGIVSMGRGGGRV
jgi:hypothetical protein